MDWNKISAIGQWVGVAIMAVTLWVVWPSGQNGSAPLQLSAWLPPTVIAGAFFVAALLHIQAARINRQASTRPRPIDDVIVPSNATTHAPAVPEPSPRSKLFES